MNRPKHYQKHMKQTTELFWIPDDGTGLHCSFDQSYHVTQRREFPVSDSHRVIDDTFSLHKRPSYPIPILSTESGGLTDVDDSCSEPSETIEPSGRSGRAFLPFPDGFWAEMRSSERCPFVPAGPVFGW
jgi:hypothetical protein